ncbi:MAG: ABC transporter permease [Alphaproteobacteria bacterium]|nr:ABC transporter permease [Alphaproteobacteria bacterium]
MIRTLRIAVIFIGLLVLWEAVVRLTGVQAFILPGPVQVLTTWVQSAPRLLPHAGVTTVEIILGMALGAGFGMLSALCLAYFRPVRGWLMPVLVISQAIPVFAIAPLLTLWLGYGIGSKVAMATLIIYFPVTAAFYDGLRRTEPGWLDLARTMNATRWAALRHVRLPAALPALGSGLRVAASVAPIGAVVGEWVGSSAGLGYLMLHANARLQTDLMFAALLTLAILALSLYYVVDGLVRWMVPWQPEAPGS